MFRQKTHKAILFADISGSSALYKTEGNLKAKEAVDILLDTLINITEKNKGKVIKTIGDEVMTCYDECNDALISAISMQKNHPLLTQSQLKMSIGVGYGEILTEDGDLFGEAVNDSAYLTQLAKGGQILLTESVFTQLNTEFQDIAREFDSIKIKGAQENSLIYRVYWQEGEAEESETQLMSNQVIDNALKSYILQLKYRSEVFNITAAQTPFVIGRDAQNCHLQIEGSQVSREHCEISFSRGKFVLIDHSTNGCYLSLANTDEFYIRREEYPLVDSISVSLGLPKSQVEEEMIELFY